MSPTWPEDDYLLKLGQVIYSISALEGLLIFDLPRMPEPVAGLAPRDLAGSTTTKIGNLLMSRARSVADPVWCTYLVRGREALVDLGPKRNRVLHARPATIEGSQRLLRWRPDPPEDLSISQSHLDMLLDEVEGHRRALDGLRPPFQ